MKLQLIYLLATIYGVMGKCSDVPQMPKWFYTTSNNLADSKRPRPNERMNLPVKFPFLGNHLCSEQEWWIYGPDCVNSEGFSSIWVNKNGILSFGDEWRDPFLNSFSRVLAFPAIAPLWSLLGFGNDSAVYYYQTTDYKPMLNRAKHNIMSSFPCASEFDPKLVVVITWYKMDIDKECDIGGDAWCDCLVRNDKNYCICDALPIEHYCRCVEDNDTNSCGECMTEIPDKTPHCDCLKIHTNETCECIFELGYSETFCHCVEYRDNPDYCGCLHYTSYSADYCKCVYIDRTGYKNCLSKRNKRDAGEPLVEPQKNERKVKNKRDIPDAKMGDSKTGSTFQAVLITDEVQSYVIFNYDSIDLQESVDGTKHGIAGFDGGMRVSPYGPEYNNPYSYSPELNNLITESNMGQPGMWMYRVDGNKVVEPVECL